MTARFVRLVRIAGTTLLFAAAPLAAQRSSTPAASASPSIVGTWTGTATIALADSAIVVPVSYTFTQTGDAIAGTATVIGQATGPISNFVRDGMHVRFRVEATQAPKPGAAPAKSSLLDHDGTIGADGTLEGMVNMNNFPVAKFKITRKR